MNTVFDDIKAGLQEAISYAKSDTSGATTSKMPSADRKATNTLMNPTVKSVMALENHTLHIQFNNGEIKEFDVTPFLDKGIFVELNDIDYFMQVKVSFGSIEWPNEQDFSRDTLYILGKTIEPPLKH